MEVAIFAAGCFWGVEQAFGEVQGVVETAVGYTGGHVHQPSYRDVCSHQTGHAEAVKVTFDPSVVSYRELVKFFFGMHDPTQVNRQGPDVGDQYRTEIFYSSEKQKQIASEEKELWSSRNGKPVTTLVVPAATFWMAEDYHQKYFQKAGGGACHYNK